MRKPKIKKKQIQDANRGKKRSLRFKNSRKKVAKKRQVKINETIKEKEKTKELLRKFEEARNKREL